MGLFYSSWSLHVHDKSIDGAMGSLTTNAPTASSIEPICIRAILWSFLQRKQTVPHGQHTSLHQQVQYIQSFLRKHSTTELDYDNTALYKSVHYYLGLPVQHRLAGQALSLIHI